MSHHLCLQCMILAGLQDFSLLPGCQILEQTSFSLYLLPWVVVKVPILCHSGVSAVAFVLVIWLWHKLAQQFVVSEVLQRLAGLFSFSGKTVFEQDFTVLHLLECCDRREGLAMDPWRSNIAFRKMPFAVWTALSSSFFNTILFVPQSKYLQLMNSSFCHSIRL